MNIHVHPRLSAAILLFCSNAALAAVDGTVINRTTDKPQQNATVTLYKLGDAGMDSLESVKSDAAGQFTIDLPVQGPHLIQTAFDGVTYNHMLPPGRPTTGLTLEVFNASSQPGEAKVATHMILLEPDGSTLSVNESLIFNNNGKTAFNNPEAGTLHFFLPEATGGKARVMCSAPGGMPIERAAEKTSTAGIYKVDFPIKPGETRFDLTYSLPLADGGAFTSKVIHDGLTRIVAPQGVTLESPDLTSLGQEPTTQATIFDLKNKNFTIAVQGSGALRGQEQAGNEEEDSGQGVQRVRPFLYSRFYPILGLTFLILLLGFLLLYRKHAGRA
ncbi:MAG: carboxypeptidase regulatory-like domain-containing protein [Acidimicrobiia bacterium]|nr:carboxypeptidase regulatory-like domain-containing protein [Acidimicrobiia bacterium]